MILKNILNEKRIFIMVIIIMEIRWKDLKEGNGKIKFNNGDE